MEAALRVSESGCYSVGVQAATAANVATAADQIIVTERRENTAIPPTAAAIV